MNPLLSAQIFKPDNLSFPLSWIGHTPFAAAIINALRPSVFVELGTHTGNSYFAFCQAVKESGLPTRCYAIDTWTGDAFAGRYGELVYKEVCRTNSAEFGDCSVLKRSTFEAARAEFSDESIDLLHIDGSHRYEDVKADFESWFPKVREGGVILIHDTHCEHENFGVWKLWNELEQQHTQTFSFSHSFGLGVIVKGTAAPEDPFLDELLCGKTPEYWRGLFQHLGRLVETPLKKQTTCAQLFIADEQGFSEPRSVRQIYKTGVSTCLEFNELEALTAECPTLHLRFDPMNQCGLVRIEAFECVLTSEQGEHFTIHPAYSITGTGHLIPTKSSNHFVSVGDDPQFRLDFSLFGSKQNKLTLSNIRIRLSVWINPPDYIHELEASLRDEDAQKLESVVQAQLAGLKKRNITEQPRENVSLRYHVEMPRVHFSSKAFRSVSVRGWVFDQEGRSARRVRIRTQGENIEARKIPRTDVFEHFANENLIDEWLGFSAEVNLQPGSQAITVEAQTQSGDWIKLKSVWAGPKPKPFNGSSHSDVKIGDLIADRLHNKKSTQIAEEVSAEGLPCGLIVASNPFFQIKIRKYLNTPKEIEEAWVQVGGKTIPFDLTDDQFTLGFNSGSGFKKISVFVRTSADKTFCLSHSTVVGLNVLTCGRAPAKMPHSIPGSKNEDSTLGTIISDVRRASSEICDFDLGAYTSKENANSQFRKICKAILNDFLSSGKYLAFDKKNQPKVSIILVLFDQAEFTLNCLLSLREQTYSDFELIILDNYSTDATRELLGRIKGVRILKAEENLNYLRGANLAAKEATGEMLLLLNNDVKILPGALEAAVARIETESDVGAVGGPIINLDGKLQEAGSIIFSDGTCRGYKRGTNEDDPEVQCRRDVDYCSAAFLLVRSKLWKQIGGFDERYAPAYYEDSDLCMEIWKAGHRVAFEPLAKIYHYEFGSSEATANRLMQANHRKFLAKHRTTLREKHFDQKIPQEKTRERCEVRKRILFIDDTIPFSFLGAGYPRALKMLRAISGAGFHVTLFFFGNSNSTYEEAYSILPRTIEFVHCRSPVHLESFMRRRIGLFDSILVSRPQNMKRFLNAAKACPEFREGVRVIYDAEAICAERDHHLAQLSGQTQSDPKAAMEEELSLTDTADAILSVNHREASIFSEYGHKNVSILGHSCEAVPTEEAPLEQRKDFLFVGRLDADFSPNTDSLIWFFEQIMPRLDEQIGSDWNLNIAGLAGDRIRAFASDRIRVLGLVDNLGDLYQSSRLFIAPTRFAAGVPLKIYETASRGLPIVATELLGEQLGWQHGSEILLGRNAQSFADACALLQHDDKLWKRLRDNALKAVARDCHPDRFNATIASVIK